MADVPDLNFTVCDDLLDDSLDGYAFAGEMKDQVAVSGAAFALEHQGQARDDVAVYTAGVEGALRAYEALLRSRPNTKAALLDDLAARRDRGELGDHVAELARERCPRPRAAMLWIATLAGAGVVLLVAFVVGWSFRRRDARGILSANRAKILRTIVFAGAAYYVLVGATLHVLEPDYDPRFKFMSDYAWSSHGWLMTTTFFVLALAILAVAFGIRDVPGSLPGARLGCGLLVVAAFGVSLAGMFRGFPLHDLAGALAFPGMAMAALFLSWRFRQAVEWRPLHRGTVLMSVGMLAALLSMIANVGWPGLQQRAFLVLFLTWLCVVANRLATITAGGISASAASPAPFRSVSLLCCLGVAGSMGCGPGDGDPIPLAHGACDVPSFIGEPASGHPLPPQFIPRHPHLAPQGANGMHADSYCTDAYPWSGPLGVNPQVTSASLSKMGGLVATVAMNREGRLVGVSGSLLEFKLLLLDPETLQVLASHTLPQRASTREFLRTGDWRVIATDTSGGAYFHLDNRDRAIIANADKVIQIFRAVKTNDTFAWLVDREYDLKGTLPENAHVIDAIPDWRGRIWFVTRTGIVGVVDPENGKVRTLVLADEEIQNTMAVARDGVYIVSDHALYRFQTDGRGSPAYTWRMTYDRGTSVKPGALSQGSGTTPTLLGDDLVAITDNADVQVNVLVYKRRRGVTGNRLVCGVPVFDPGYSASENSLIGYGRSLIVENNYAYGTGLPLDRDPRSHPGVTRIDVVEGPQGLECRKVWESREASQTTVAKLSIANGLVYLYTRLEDAPEDVLAWYLTALDFETGRTVFKTFTGTGILWNNYYAPITLGPDGTAYVGVYNGIVAVRDGREGEPPRDLRCP